MARVKNQGARRAEIIAAAKNAIARRGLTGLRLKDVAQECGLTAGAVAYYYPDLDGLVQEVHRDASQRFSELRRRRADRETDPRAQLRRLIAGGMPASTRDVDFQVLNELHVHAYRDTYHARLMADLFEQEAALYAAVVAGGMAEGVFTLQGPGLTPATVARSIVALEDAYGLHLLGGSRLTLPQATRMLLQVAGCLVGCDLAPEDLASDTAG